MDKFNLLLKNPLLESYVSRPVQSKYVTDILGYQLTLPSHLDKPFIFSCFVLSVDGKLYYPDTHSGYSIAACNYQATLAQRQADLFTLMLARTLADGIIVGTTSINNELNEFLPHITNSHLQKIRSANNLPATPCVLVVCRDLTNINFNNKLFSDNEHQVIICCLNNPIDLDKLPHSFQQLRLYKLENKQDLSLKNLVFINDLDELSTELFRLGFQVILNESPYFHHKLLKLEILDELWLNYSGVYIGGSISGLGNTQTPFDSIDHPECEILTLHTLGYNFIYTRQKIRY